MQIWIPVPLYNMIREAQDKYQRRYGNDLRRIDVLVPPETYNHICKIQQEFLHDSRNRGKSQLTMSEVIRIMLEYAIEYEAQYLEVNKKSPKPIIK